MVDVKKFWIHVHTTGVKKGWDWIELPDGRRIRVPEGKYIKVMAIGNKTAIGFEDLTDEIGEKPDWDYQTPMCIVDEEVDGVQKVAKLRCRFTGRYHVSLFYEGIKVAEFWWGKTFDAPTFSYVDVQALSQQLQIAPAPVIPQVMPAFDYIIDIYADKVVVTDSYGNTTTLSSINDLNSWLKNVRGKRIRINTRVVVTQDLVLTSNEYWIFGEPIDACVFVVEPNITIISFAPLGNERYNRLVGNYIVDASGSWVPVDASGFKLFATYADVLIEKPESLSGYMPASIYVMSSFDTCLVGVEGDVVVNGHYVYLIDCKLKWTRIDAGDLYLDNCVAGRQDVIILSRFTELINNVNLISAPRVELNLLFEDKITVNANSSVSISLPPYVTSNLRRIYVEQIGVIKTYQAYTPPLLKRLEWVEPLPPGVSYNIDGSNNVIVITNNTSNNVDVKITYRIAEMW